MKVYLKEEFIDRYPDYALRIDVSYNVLNAFIDDDTTLYEVNNDIDELVWVDSVIFMTQDEYKERKSGGINV